MRAAAPLAVSTAAVALGLGAAGCSIKDDNANAVVGKQLFVQKCGSCHVLGRAGTKGVTGPNLDEAFAQSRRDGLGESGIRGLVRKQIGYPSRPGQQGTGVMPAGLVKGDKARDVAAYVASVVSKPGKDSGLLATAVKAAGSGKPAVAKGGVLSIPADPNGQLQFVNATATAPAGTISIEMPNTSGVAHNIAIDGVGKGAIVPKGVSKFSGTLKPGKYTYYCQVPGHLQAGMKGTLTVK